jgi:hypothetical protein
MNDPYNLTAAQRYAARMFLWQLDRAIKRGRQRRRELIARCERMIGASQ